MAENWCRLILGFSASVVGGHLVLWPLIEKLLWRSAAKRHGFDYEGTRAHFSWIVGVVERFLYTAAFVLGAWEWVGVWLAVKVVARWQSSTDKNKRTDSDNIWLVGTGLSLLIGYLGASIALGYFPHFPKP